MPGAHLDANAILILIRRCELVRASGKNSVEKSAHVTLRDTAHQGVVYGRVGGRGRVDHVITMDIVQAFTGYGKVHPLFSVFVRKSGPLSADIRATRELPRRHPLVVFLHICRSFRSVGINGMLGKRNQELQTTMSQSPAWKSIIRFRDSSGVVHFGQPSADFARAQIYDGSDILHLSVGSDVVNVAEVSDMQG
jgi:hypothetical protein